jgi:opacity protein-like surface antigen
MKKFLLAMVLSATTSVAFAADSFLHLQYGLRDTVADQSSAPNRQGVNFTVGHKVLDNLTIDLSHQFRTEKLNSDDGKNTTRFDLGATYTQALTENVAFYTRGALGYKLSTSSDYTYYSIEPGVKAKLTSDLTVKVGYRFRDSFSDAYDEKTNTVRLGAEYAVAKNQSVTLAIDRSYGASEFMGYTVGYAVKF